MNDDLANRLLRAVMDWDGEDADLADLELLGELNHLALYKYNQYQQYRPGLQFIESLALWLNEFENAGHREIALRFIRERLIFISDQEMRHLVEILFADLVRPIIRDTVARTLSLPKYLVRAIDYSPEFGDELRHSMFLGLSDGARIDELRRSAALHNDQVEASYRLGYERAAEMRSSLETGFRHVFLIDDFYGSGKSIIRWEKDGDWLSDFEDGAVPTGRLQKFAMQVSDENFRSIFSDGGPALHICLYVATSQALEHIRNAIDAHPDPPWGSGLKPTVDAAMIISDRSRLICGVTDRESDALLHDRYDPDVMMNEHRKVGGDQIVHGFSDCGLPLVFAHNTPNNSVYLLWETLKPYVALFPRVDRHKPGS